jgi:hypothetical protein
VYLKSHNTTSRCKWTREHEMWLQVEKDDDRHVWHLLNLSHAYVSACRRNGWVAYLYIYGRFSTNYVVYWIYIRNNMYASTECYFISFKGLHVKLWYQFWCTRCTFQLIKSIQWYSSRKSRKSERKLWNLKRAHRKKPKYGAMKLSHICRR